MARQGKRILNAYKAVDAERKYSLSEAVKLVKENAKAKFDETVDVAVNLNIDTRKSDQNLRGMLSLPHGTGKSVRVAVFAKDDNVAKAKDAGADIVGSDDLIEKIQKGEIDFDRCIATPDMMAMVGKVSRILGPKGLMPNPKLGTVTTDVAKAVKDAKAGQLEYRAEKSGIIHAGVAKVSFSEAQIEENIKFFIKEMAKLKPSSVKGTYMKAVSISSSMGPGVKVDIAEII